MENARKTILILGNGFDLAHSLPTKYSDFLEFSQRVECIWTYGLNKTNTVSEFKMQWLSEWKTDKFIRLAIEEAFINRNIVLNGDNHTVTSDNAELTEIHNMLEDNVWYLYFIKQYENNAIKGENWIDFESEIRDIIKEVDMKSTSLSNLWLSIEKPKGSKLEKFNNHFINFCHFLKNEPVTIRFFREKTFNDLERLIHALELYLSSFVEKIQVNIMIPEILNLNPDYVINFNYTNTYERLYNKGTVYHIHGKADANRPAVDNNMVLGIDEYWSNDEKNNKTDFTIFKKFAQRIQKHTGNDSYRYFKEIRALYSAEGEGTHWTGMVDKAKDQLDGISYVYVFGHSLDVTDKDILSSFIGDTATAVTVYCYNKGTEGELIANTIKLIGEEMLINKANSIPPKLDYVIQKPVSCTDCESISVSV